MSALAQAGFEPLEAATGTEALECATRERPGLVVLDVRLPDLSGYEVCRELRDRLGASVPVMFVSGERIESFDRVAGLLVGGDDYLVKPFELDELVARARRLVERPARSTQTSNDRPRDPGTRAAGRRPDPGRGGPGPDHQPQHGRHAHRAHLREARRPTRAHASGSPSAAACSKRRSRCGRGAGGRPCRPRCSRRSSGSPAACAASTRTSGVRTACRCVGDGRSRTSWSPSAGRTPSSIWNSYPRGPSPRSATSRLPLLEQPLVVRRDPDVAAQPRAAPRAPGRSSRVPRRSRGRRSPGGSR